MARRLMGCTLLFAISILFAVPLLADKASDEQTLRNAASVLQAMLDSKDIPGSVIAKADCILVLPSVKKFAVGVGGSGGRGPMSCREGKDFHGKWSAPAMYSVGGASAGLQIGGTATDYVVLIMAPSAAEKIMNGKIKVGSDATAAAGPGASTSTSSGADMLTYSRTKGLFAGVSLNGASLDADEDANHRLYGSAVTAQQILTGGDVKTTPAGHNLVALLDSHIH
jgi:SH3 domain-containing YSC84-like protein 1